LLPCRADRPGLMAWLMLVSQQKKTTLTTILEEGSLTVYRQPLIAAGGNPEVKVKVRNVIGEPRSARLDGIKGRCPKAASGDGLDERNSLKIGLKGEGGERTVPGVSSISAELGDGTVASEIALLS
jgi:hypothetical protein